MRTIIRGGLITLALTAAASPALACSPDPFMAEVCTTAASYCPDGYLPANGQLLQIQQFPPLFMLLSNRFGGDGRTTFALPNLRSTQPPPQGLLTQCIAVRGAWPQPAAN